MALTDADVIRQIIAPATMIPACGLLLLSTTARMNTVLARIRAFHHERLDVWRLDAKPGSRDQQVRDLRLEGLEHQTHRLLSRAWLLRCTMLLLFVAVGCNLLAALGLAARLVVGEAAQWLETAPEVVFIVGIVLMGGAMVSSFLEVLRILETVWYEHRRVEQLCATTPDDEGASAEIRPPEAIEGTGL